MQLHHSKLRNENGENETYITRRRCSKYRTKDFQGFGNTETSQMHLNFGR